MVTVIVFPVVPLLQLYVQPLQGLDTLSVLLWPEQIVLFPFIMGLVGNVQGVVTHIVNVVVVGAIPLPL